MEKLNKKNLVAKILMIVGAVVAIVGVIGGLLLAIEYFIEVWGTVILGSLLSALSFIAVAEIIELLQDAADTQKAILNHLAGDSGKTQNAPKAVIDDIEANLPEM